MKPYGIKYLVSYHPEMYGLHADTAGTLDVVNLLTGNVFWFDNDELEWHKSIYSADSVLGAIGDEYQEVQRFDNGYVNTDDIWSGIGGRSLVGRYPEEFAVNLKRTEEENEIVVG